MGTELDDDMPPELIDVNDVDQVRDVVSELGPPKDTPRVPITIVTGAEILLPS